MIEAQIMVNLKILSVTYVMVFLRLYPGFVHMSLQVQIIILTTNIWSLNSVNTFRENSNVQYVHYFEMLNNLDKLDIRSPTSALNHLIRIFWVNLQMFQHLNKFYELPCFSEQWWYSYHLLSHNIT